MHQIRRTKVRRTAEQWEEIIELFEGSGMSQSDYCEREGILLTSFHKWR